MGKTATAALAAMLVLSAAPRASAFAPAGTGPGTHMGSMLSALNDLYSLEAAPPVIPGKLPKAGTLSIRWESYGAAQLMADAACDADFYFFGVPAAHAQTGDFGYGKRRNAESLRKIEAKAVLGYLKFLDGWLSKARKAFDSGDPEKGLYLLGFASHAYQDLWAHRGITNGMHKAFKEAGFDVDDNGLYMEEMREGLAEWLSALPELLGPGTARAYLDAVLSPRELKRPSGSKRAKMLGRRKDAYWEGAMYVLSPGVSMKNNACLFEVQWDVEALNAILLDPRAFGQAAALDDPEEAADFLESRGYVFLP